MHTTHNRTATRTGGDIALATEATEAAAYETDRANRRAAAWAKTHPTANLVVYG